MTDLEDALTRTLARAAGHAPTAPPDLVRRVGARHTRKRRDLILVAASVAVVAVGSTLTLRHLTPSSERGVPAVEVETISPAPTGSAPASTEPRLPPLVGQVWPEAVREIPATLPNGRRFRPVLYLDDHTLLINTESGFEKADMLSAYDLDTGKATELARITTPPRAVIFASDFTTGHGTLAWWTQRKQGQGTVVDIWGVPVTGGTPQKITSFPGELGGLDHLAIAGGKIAWSLTKGGGVHQAPLSGGEAAPIPGTRGMHLIQWPWAASPSAFDTPESQETQPIFGHLLNVETGERREAIVKPGDRPGICGITWCIGGRPDQNGSGHYVAHRRDGSAEREIPGSAKAPPALDRFIVAPASGRTGLEGVVLYDIVTGRGGDLGIRRGEGGSLSSPRLMSGAQSLLSYTIKGEMTVIDLTAIK